jgi:hypothetical protein
MTDYPETITRKDEIKFKIDTIRKQAGIMTLMSIGARDFVYSDGYAEEGTPYDVRLTFKVLRRQKKLTITLCNDDTYTVKAWHIPSTRAKDPSPRLLHTSVGVYCDTLSESLIRICDAIS